MSVSAESAPSGTMSSGTSSCINDGNRTIGLATATGACTFESFYASVCGELQAKGEVHSVSKLFSQFSTDEERMRFVLERGFISVNSGGAAAGILAAAAAWKEFNFAQKDRSESQKLRNLGNQVYQKNKLSEALELYTQSICLAPHPPPPNALVLHHAAATGSDENSTYEELALGYANRSAVLFQIKKYELCVRDITRAFDHSYPNNLMYKLFERKSRCLKALKDYPRALESMKNAQMWMKYSTLNETKTATFKQDVAKQIQLLEEKVAGMSVSDFKAAFEHRREQAAPYRVTETPMWENETGAEVLCARKDVQLMYREDKGRYLVATEDIPPGEILLVETPYSSILLPDYYKTHCQTCYHRIQASSIPCWFCAKVRFCSDVCRMESWERFHKVECQQLNLILDPTLGKMAMLTMRILTSSGKIYLDYVIGKLAEEEAAQRGKPDAARKIGFNEDGCYDSSDYRTLYTLVSNSRQRGVGDLFKRSLMALYLLRILESTPFFYNGGSDPRSVKLSDKVAMGSVILKHLQNLPCNAHEISEMELQGNSSREIGGAAFTTLSLLNHSCDPNVVRHNYSCNGVVRSIRSIKKGEELLDNYGYHYALMPKEERQRKLYNQYYFRCECVACIQNWPTYENLPVTMVLKSAHEQKTSMSDAQKLSKAFRKNFDVVVQGNYVETLPSLLDYLSFLDGNICRPLKEYNDCQEAIKQCYAATANVHRKQSKKE